MFWFTAVLRDGNRVTTLLLAVFVLTLLPATGHAVPSFARQTGEKCISCHVSFPELTPFGRFFKLTGYTLQTNRSAPSIPLAVMIQTSVTSTRNTTASDPIVFQDNDSLVLQQASLFVSGRIVEHLGLFSQWTYDGVAHHSQVDNVDFRAIGRSVDNHGDLIYGLDVNNNPTAQDVWNSTPAFGFPFASSGVAIAPAASTMIDGTEGQQVVGVSGYFFWNKLLYGEFGSYRTANRGFSLFRAGTDLSAALALRDYNPYWRMALNREWGAHSVMVGAFGMLADAYPDNTAPSGPTDDFRDTALDAQYQYITDPHTVTAQVTWIHEKQDWEASYPSVTQNPTDTLNSFKAKLTYYYRRKYGVTLARFSTTGSTDTGLYGPAPVTGSKNGSPNSSGYILEFNYVPLQNIRFALQYTAYQKFNGLGNDYDGFGRNARDNNTMFLLGWFVF